MNNFVVFLIDIYYIVEERIIFIYRCGIGFFFLYNDVLIYFDGFFWILWFYNKLMWFFIVKVVFLIGFFEGKIWLLKW